MTSVTFVVAALGIYYSFSYISCQAVQVGKSAHTLPKKILPLRGIVLFSVAFHFSYSSLFKSIVTCSTLSEVMQLTHRVFFMFSSGWTNASFSEKGGLQNVWVVFFSSIY